MIIKRFDEDSPHVGGEVKRIASKTKKKEDTIVVTIYSSRKLTGDQLFESMAMDEERAAKEWLNERISDKAVRKLIGDTFVWKFETGAGGGKQRAYAFLRHQADKRAADALLNASGTETSRGIVYWIEPWKWESPYPSPCNVEWQRVPKDERGAPTTDDVSWRKQIAERCGVRSMALGDLNQIGIRKHR